MNRTTTVNTKTLRKKAQTHSVTRTAYATWDVVSGGSGKTYSVAYDTVRREFYCGCDWTSYGGGGCSHVMAVIMWADAERERKAYFQNSEESAKRQRRPRKVLAEGYDGKQVWVTSRANS